MKKRMLVGLVMAFFALSFMGTALAQQAAPAGPPPIVKDMLAKAKASVQKVSAADVKAMMDKKDKVIYLDVRDPREFAGGHLPGAMNISRGTLEFNAFKKIQDQNSKIIVYCKTGGRASLATKTLNDLGFKNAVMMDASFESWVKAGYPVAR